ncbi:MAG: hypothetical protein F4Z02_13000 [Acidimicrobiia bacterium]|nr:hypothetical protein [Acidimicrobiia bacterium]MYG72551.1 hypothetical protein [Acidimicrobiia bacterium]
MTEDERNRFVDQIARQLENKARKLGDASLAVGEYRLALRQKPNLDLERRLGGPNGDLGPWSYSPSTIPGFMIAGDVKFVTRELDREELAVLAEADQEFEDERKGRSLFFRRHR